MVSINQIFYSDVTPLPVSKNDFKLLSAHSQPLVRSAISFASARFVCVRSNLVDNVPVDLKFR